MNSLYGGGEGPAGTGAGPSTGYGSSGPLVDGVAGGSTVGGGGGETGDAAYYQVTRGGDYTHHYASGGAQYEVLTRSIIRADGTIQEHTASYYSLEPHRPIPIHPSSLLLPPLPTPPPLRPLLVPTRDDKKTSEDGVPLIGLLKPESSVQGLEETESDMVNRRLARRRRGRSTRSRSTSAESQVSPSPPPDSERESVKRKKKADQARARYHRMTEEERREYNLARRLKQRGVDEATGLPIPPTPQRQSRQQQANNRKAAAARQKYHQMTEAQKKEYNMKRTEAFRKKRREEEELMSAPAVRVTHECYAKAQAIVNRNSKKALAARTRYALMSPQERKEYNQRRAELKKNRDRALLGTRAAMGTTIMMGGGEQEQEEHQGEMHFHEGESFEESLVYPKEEGEGEAGRGEGGEGPEEEEEEGVEEIVEEVEVDMEDGSLVLEGGMPRDSSPPSHVTLTPLIGVGAGAAAAVAVDGTEEGGEEAEERARAAAGGGVVGVKGQPTKAAQRIIRAVAEAQESLQYERARQQRGEYEDNWNLHPSTSLGGVMIGDGARVVYADPRSVDHIEVEDDLHHMQSRSASNGVYEYAEHAIDDVHYVDGPDMVQHEVEVQSHSPHAHRGLHLMPHHLHHAHHVVHHMGGGGGGAEGADVDIDVVHADEEDEEEDDEDTLADPWNDSEQRFGLSDQPYHPRMTKTMMNERAMHRGDIHLTASRVLEQRARKALRSRLRYANMSEEEKARHNAARAAQLRESRRRDLRLLQMAESEEVLMNEDMRKLVSAAKERRNKRAEQARQKYRRMSEEERKAYNAMRDAQRRSRRRDMEGLTDAEEAQASERNETRRVRGGGPSMSALRNEAAAAAAAAADDPSTAPRVDAGVGGAGGGPAPSHHHLHHLQQRDGGGGGGVSSEYVYEMYEEWAGPH